MRTSFSRIHEGALVNLELPMKADGRFGGHIVQGHVDGVGKLIAFERIAESENWWLHIELPDDVEKYTVYKGSISIEGISLTVAKLEKNRCTIAIIPHTVEMTNLHSLKPGDPVNLEADLIAKYVEKMMKGERREFADRRRPGAARVLKAVVGSGLRRYEFVSRPAGCALPGQPRRLSPHESTGNWRLATGTVSKLPASVRPVPEIPE